MTTSPQAGERIVATATAVIERLIGLDMPSMRDLAVISALDLAYGPGSRAEGTERGESR